MAITLFVNSDWYTWVIIPLLIFFARILDVTIGTIRLIFVSRGLRFVSAVLGFCEVLIWLIAIRHILTNLTNYVAYVAYAAGFATGTYIGICLEERISIGKVMITIITKKKATELVKALKKTRHTVTTSEGIGRKGKVKIIFMIIRRHDVRKIVGVMKEYNPSASYSVEDIRLGDEERLPPVHYKRKKMGVSRYFRKSK